MLKSYPLEMEMWPTPRNMLLLHLYYQAKFGHSRSNHTSVIMKICQKNLSPHVPPFKATQSHLNLCYFYFYLNLIICLQLDIALLFQNSVKIWHCLPEL